MITDGVTLATSVETGVDLKAQHANLYRPSSRAVSLVEVPPVSLPTLDGSGGPNTSREYPQAIEALYGLTYFATFLLKRALGVSVAAIPLECL